MTAKHDKLLAALLSAPTIERAAKAAGLSEATALRYLKEDDFKAEYAAARRELVSHAITSLQRQSVGAVAVLCDIANDGTAPASSRVSAARTVLDLAMRAVELEDLQARVEALEGVLKANGN